jgi:hypothetical protein
MISQLHVLASSHRAPCQAVIRLLSQVQNRKQADGNKLGAGAVLPLAWRGPGASSGPASVPASMPWHSGRRSRTTTTWSNTVVFRRHVRLTRLIVAISREDVARQQGYDTGK